MNWNFNKIFLSTIQMKVENYLQTNLTLLFMEWTFQMTCNIGSNEMIVRQISTFLSFAPTNWVPNWLLTFMQQPTTILTKRYYQNCFSLCARLKKLTPLMLSWVFGSVMHVPLERHLLCNWGLSLQSFESKCIQSLVPIQKKLGNS